MAKSLYVLVHHLSVQRCTLLSNRVRKVWDEIERIQSYEDFILCPGDYKRVVQLMPSDAKTRKVMVCGAFRDRKKHQLCVDQTCMILKKNGYDAEIYRKATLDGDFNRR